MPLVGLKYDILRRAREFNIPCSIFEENQEFKNLTLISIESITNPTFISLVQSLINSSNLDRIIIDECHLLISASNYRIIMFKFREILLLSTQIIFLTGTLPLSFQESLTSSLALEDLSIIRASCSRLNISYRTSVYKSNIEEARIYKIKDYINRFQSTEFLTKDDKVLIFCPSTSNIELVANSLNCSRYYASLSNEDKEETLSNFRISQDPYYSILVTSSSLEEGFDYSFIRLVVYKDLAYSFLGFLQGSSRGGRDNKPSTSIFFYNSRDSRLASTSSNSSINSSLLDYNKNLVNSYLLETVCRRRQINLYLDNKLIEQYSNLENKCNLCLTRSSITSKQVSRVKESFKDFELKRTEIISNIIQINRTCIFCTLLRNKEDVLLEEHTSSTCPLYNYVESLSKKIKSLITKKEVTLVPNSCCFSCLLPTVICRHLRENQDACLFPKFLYRVLALFWFKKEVLGLVSQGLIQKNNSYTTLTSKFTKLVYLEEINTEGILVFKTLVFDS